MKKVLFFVVFFIFAGLIPVQMDLIEIANGQPNNVGTPTLLAPTGKVDLTGKETLKFQWTNGLEGTLFKDYYDFRVYKGSETNNETLIYKEQVPASTFKTEVNADLFEKGAVYSWTLVHVIDVERSIEAYFTFEVVSK